MQGIAVLVMVEIAEGEERKPISLIWAYAMNKHKGQGQLPRYFLGIKFIIQAECYIAKYQKV